MVNNSWQTVLVTGGGGFVGSHLVEALAAMPEVTQVIATAQNPKKTRQSIPKSRLEICEITNREKMKELIERVRPKVIFHTISPGPFAPKRLQLEVSYIATRNLLEIARESESVQALIYTSSLGACSSAFGHLSSPLREEEVQPNTLDTGVYWYYRTKGATDTLVLKANSPKPSDAENWSGHLLTASLRTPGLYGPRDTTMSEPIFGMVNTLGARVQWGSDIPVHEWLYIDNCVLAHVLTARKLLENPNGIGGEAFFVTDGKSMKFHQFVRTIYKEAGDKNMNSRDPRFIVVPMWLLLSLLAVWEWVYEIATLGRGWPSVSRQNFTYIRKGTRLSIEKARARLGYEPKVTTEDGIRRTVAWFKEKESKKTK
ncbi:hypothetical protein BCR34DRAFT_558842 [Clohesyomyces aquaticus]|uniref:3-beta hydroxysteroid dehydrogenase/isomerase domain-containing protein n=1 Tax=Clohesyomyces aquaticus TaxID=1231657 RepID=A0A1Y1ZZ20_9PLEO|nr:hypothetical protein BCR34DRAFT_558842 [Clohesyomyces aquaticus]